MKSPLLTTIADSIRNNWDLPALSDFQGVTFSYSQLAQKIVQMHLLFEGLGLKPGDKVALCAKNSAEWGITFLGALTYGVVVVPLLHEFSVENIEHLVTHSEARLLFTEKSIAEKLSEENMPKVEGVVLLPDYEVFFAPSEKLRKVLAGLSDEYGRRYPDGITVESLEISDRPAEEVALINYTSGSTGNSKGVMITYGNLWGNINFALGKILFLHPGDGMVSMLPLAHMYGLVYEFLFPLCKGCHITFLGRVPSPKIVTKAFAEVKPKLIITVPLVIEKIVRGQVMPELQKPMMRFLTAIPGVRSLIYKAVREKMLKAFGGNLQELILGGAPVSDEVEALLRKIGFPFTIGYGMTECAPLVTYEWWANQRPGSCGRLVDGMEAKVQSPDPENVPGVLFVRGTNVMKGYFKNEKATKEALQPDGWLNTGDICTIDRDGYMYIRGRDKNMILGPSGQNIYPEEIEAKLNTLPLVAESVVVERDGKIVALVHPDYDAGSKQGMNEEQVDEAVLAQLPALNKMLPVYSRVNRFEIRAEAFEKTPKHSIRRFLYQ